MASSTADDADDESEREIRLVETGKGWVATDVEWDVTSQGETRTAALENLDDAVALRRGDRGRPPSDAELSELGIDPDDNVTGEDEPADVLE